MADDGGSGADGGGEHFELDFPSPLLDNFDVLELLDLSNVLGDDDVAPPAPVQMSVDGGGGKLLPGSSGDDLVDWSAVFGNCSKIDGEYAPPPIQELPPPVVHGGASVSTSTTSSAAPAPAPPQEVTVDCSGCQVLREVVHSNGLETTKLCIHGGVAGGEFYHAILDVHRVNASVPAPTLAHHSIINFRGRDYEWVKQYLTEYALRRAGGGFAVVQDSLSAFHDALCTTMAPCSSHVDDDAHKRASSAAAKSNGNGDHQLVVHNAAVLPIPESSRCLVAADQAAATNNNGSGDRRLIVDTTAATAIQPPASGPSQASHTSHHVQQRFHLAARSALAIQRERTKQLQLGDIAPYFELPIAKAARKLDVCATALKGICRKHGVLRWPYRKVRSIDRQIATLRRTGNGDATRDEIETLIASRRRIVAGLE
uniref:RWP-RK domain-containing protein n=1 Tax=Oryza punctata TaxID=4537 RepID=A0A0E0MKV9_ORYPU